MAITDPLAVIKAEVRKLEQVKANKESVGKKTSLKKIVMTIVTPII